MKSSASIRVQYELPVTMLRLGHVVPFQPGDFVECVYRNANVSMYTQLDVSLLARADRGEALQMKEAGVGSVLLFDWYIDPLELRRARIDERNVEWNAAIRGPYRCSVTGCSQEMWYLVAFARGFFWACWNWLEPVRNPSSGIGDRLLQQRAAR